MDKIFETKFITTWCIFFCLLIHCICDEITVCHNVGSTINDSNAIVASCGDQSLLFEDKGEKGEKGCKGGLGEKGANGTRGTKGEKGETGKIGIANRTEIANLQGTIKQLQSQIKSIQTGIDVIQSTVKQGYKNLNNGWVSIFNGYQYKVTSNKATWGSSRATCRQWGGDLAVYGVQNFESRILLIRILSLKSKVWIGLTDQAAEGTWVWLNGNGAQRSVVVWANNQPDNYRNNEDCAEILVGKSQYGSVNDGDCSWMYFALCEKRV